MMLVYLLLAVWFFVHPLNYGFASSGYPAGVQRANEKNSYTIAKTKTKSAVKEIRRYVRKIQRDKYRRK